MPRQRERAELRRKVKPDRLHVSAADRTAVRAVTGAEAEFNAGTRHRRATAFPLELLGRAASPPNSAAVEQRATERSTSTSHDDADRTWLAIDCIAQTRLRCDSECTASWSRFRWVGDSSHPRHHGGARRRRSGARASAAAATAAWTIGGNRR